MQRNTQFEIQVRYHYSHSALTHSPHSSLSQLYSHFKPNPPYSPIPPKQLLLVLAPLLPISIHFQFHQSLIPYVQYAARRLPIHALLASAGAFFAFHCAYTCTIDHESVCPTSMHHFTWGLHHPHSIYSPCNLLSRRPGLQDMFLLPPPTSHHPVEVNFELQVTAHHHPLLTCVWL